MDRGHSGGPAETDTARVYRAFARYQARGSSPRYEEWAEGIADDEAVLAVVARLPPARRQPNLVLGCARLLGAPEAGYAQFRTWVLAHQDAVVAECLVRATQTNEPGRCAVLLPSLARLPQPLALVEVGASAGLCLLPDRYSYEYTDGRQVRRLDPTTGPSDVVLRCRVDDLAVVPDAVPEVAWRAGVDLHPLDVTDDDAVRWLRTLVWPGEDERRARLEAALALAATDPPSVVEGDLLEVLPGLAAQAPPSAHLVVVHSAVLAYLGSGARATFTDLVQRIGATWLSNEGATVVPDVATRLPAGYEPGGAFVLAQDGVPRALTHPHGAWYRGLAGAAGTRGPSAPARS